MTGFNPEGWVLKKECVRGLAQELTFLVEAFRVGSPCRAQWLLPYDSLEEAIALSLGDNFSQWPVEWRLLGWLWWPAQSPTRHQDGSAPSSADSSCRKPHVFITLHCVCGPLALHRRALWKGIRVTSKWLEWEGFRYGVGFNSMWFLFPFRLYSGRDWFLSGGSQLPRCCNLFLGFCRQSIFLSSSRVLPPKENIRTPCPLLIVAHQCWHISP